MTFSFPSQPDLQREMLLFLQKNGGKAMWLEIFYHMHQRGMLPKGYKLSDEELDPFDVVYLKELNA